MYLLFSIIIIITSAFHGKLTVSLRCVMLLTVGTADIPLTGAYNRFSILLANNPQFAVLSRNKESWFKATSVSPPSPQLSNYKYFRSRYRTARDVCFCLQPEQLRSPTWVQNFRKANCFESATFLASLLLGQGYNAFVVSGYASREQTLCDQTRRSCPYVPQPEKQPQPETAAKPVVTKYKLQLPTEYKSQFLSELEEEKARKLQEKLLLDEKEQQKLIEVINVDFSLPSILLALLHRGKNYIRI